MGKFYYNLNVRLTKNPVIEAITGENNVFFDLKYPSILRLPFFTTDCLTQFIVFWTRHFVSMESSLRRISFVGKSFWIFRLCYKISF